MILRRVIDHVKHQNWTAVALDFVIVVVGVFIGLQVQDWSADRAEKEAIAAQLSSFREELIQRRTAIDEQQAYIRKRIDDASMLRAGLMNQDRAISESDIYALAMSALRTNGLDVTFHGFDGLSISGAISKIQSPEQLQKLYQWDAALTNLRSTEKDVQTLRDLSGLPAALDALSFGNMARTDERYSDMPFAEQFSVDVEALRNNRDFDNTLVSRIILERQKLDALLAFENATNDLIDEIEGGQ